MSFRETEKILEISDRKFVVKKMTPLLGIAILKELLTRSLPINILGMLDGKAFDNNTVKSLLNVTNKISSAMSIEEFVEFEQRILMNVYERLPSGEVQVIDSYGNYRVENLENDMNLVLRLLVEVIKVNYTGFFIEILQELKMIIPMEEEEPQE